MNSFGKRCGLVCASNPLLWQDYIYLQDFAEEEFIVINFASLRTCIAGKSSTPAKSPWPGTDMALPCLKEPDAVHCYSSQISSGIHLLFSALVRPSDSQASYTCDQTDPYWHKQSKAPAGAPTAARLHRRQGIPANTAKPARGLSSPYPWQTHPDQLSTLVLRFWISALQLSTPAVETIGLGGKPEGGGKLSTDSKSICLASFVGLGNWCPPLTFASAPSFSPFWPLKIVSF